MKKRRKRKRGHNPMGKSAPPYPFMFKLVLHTRPTHKERVKSPVWLPWIWDSFPIFGYIV